MCRLSVIHLSFDTFDRQKNFFCDSDTCDSDIYYFQFCNNSNLDLEQVDFRIWKSDIIFFFFQVVISIIAFLPTISVILQLYIFKVSR